MNAVQKISILLLGVLISSVSLCAQEKKLNVHEALVIDGDTIPVVVLNEFEITELALTKAQKRRYRKRYGKIRRKVIKAYPYAKVTRELLQNYDEELAKLESEKEKKEYLDVAEAELKEEFEGEIRNLTVSEGKILIKLIDRETGDTSFELIKRLKGGFTAFMYQSIARLFGSNLKSEYNPEGDDQIIEEIVLQIESGEIYVPPKQAVTTKAQKRLKRKERREKRRSKRRSDSVIAGR
ncbi:MAG: DUF4294 domain-containing protein [Flavobacteriales bacterium]|nr:DUF4294 domain-containing protein [Flavobacteriales bacterium]NNK80048.1 DUF4294 domain-containing protein [Flavobacteriales bacterium]